MAYLLVLKQFNFLFWDNLYLQRVKNSTENAHLHHFTDVEILCNHGTFVKTKNLALVLHYWNPDHSDVICFPTNVLFLPQNPIQDSTLRLVVRLPLGTGTVYGVSLFLWLWWFWRACVRYFVECPLVWVCLMLFHDYSGENIIGVSVSSYTHIRRYVTSRHVTAAPPWC